MKLNNRGFAISTTMYMILIMAIVLITLTLSVLSARKMVLDKIRKETNNNIYNVYDITYREALETLKEEYQDYLTTNNIISTKSIKISDLDTSIDSNIINGYNLNDKYLTNIGSSVYLGKSKTITDISTIQDKFIDIYDAKIYGNTTQQTYTGKNLLNNETVSTSNQYVRKQDGYATAPSATGGEWRHSDYIEIKPNTTYFFNQINSTASTAGGAWYNENKVYISGYNATELANASNLMTSPNNAKYLRHSWRIDEGYNTDWENTVMIAQSNTTTEYEPYVGGIASPNPDYPQEIVSVGDNYNLLNFYDRSLGTLSGVSNTTPRDFDFDKYYVGLTSNNYYNTGAITSYDIEDGEWKVVSRSSGYGVAFPIKVEPNTQYIISGYSSGYVGLGYYDAEGNYLSLATTGNNTSNVSFFSQAFKTPDNCYITTIVLRPNAEGVYKNIQVEKGTKNNHYNQYGKYNIPITISGKNLFKQQGTVPTGPSGLTVTYDPDTQIYTIDGTQTKQGNIVFSEGHFDIEPGEQITLSVRHISGDVTLGEGTGITYAYSIFSQDNSKYIRSSNISITTFPELYSFTGNMIKDSGGVTNRVMLQLWRVGTVFNNYKIKIQIEKGSTVTDYEPYVTPITNNIYLNEPLRKIGDYSDYIDLKNSKVIRNTGEYAIIGNESMAQYSTSQTFYFNNVLNGVRYDSSSMVMSNYYKGQIAGGGTSHTTGDVWVQATNAYPRTYFGTTYTTGQDFRNFLTSKYNSGNPVMIYYQLATPTEEDLSIYHTSYGEYTNISVDTSLSPSNMEFTVIEKIREI